VPKAPGTFTHRVPGRLAHEHNLPTVIVPKADGLTAARSQQKKKPPLFKRQVAARKQRYLACASQSSTSWPST